MNRSCTAIVQSTYVIEMLVYLPWAGKSDFRSLCPSLAYGGWIIAFSGLRALALSRTWPLALFVFCISLVPIAVNWVRHARRASFVAYNADTLRPITGELLVR